MMPIENLDPPTICDNCIHDEVCGLEGHLEPACTYCGWKEERKPKGTWIKGPEISRTMIGDRVKCIEYKDYTCSNCGLVLDYLLYHWDGSPFYKFCPECGAEMREETNND